MAFVAHYDLELYQMNVKTVFLNENLEEEIYIDQPEGFFIKGKEHIVYINFAVQMLGRYQSNQRLDHWKAAKKVLRYLQGTKDHMLTYRRSSHLKVIRCSDSEYVECVDTKKSTFGYLFLLDGGAILWKSAKQSVIVASTIEAKFVACFEATIKKIGCGTLFWGLELSTLLPSG
ncbi:hypothetical protein UlMin_043288 [Ulmus minor]